MTWKAEPLEAEAVKKAIFSAYAAYVRHCPVERGKHFLGQLLSRTLGHAIYMVDGVKLELNPAGWLDRELMCGKAHNPIVSEVIAHSLKDPSDAMRTPDPAGPGARPSR